MAVRAAASDDAGFADAATFRVTLPTAEAQQSIKFGLARARSGKDTAIIIDRLSGGVAASEAGVRPGQRLWSISDPIRANEMWQLNDRPSIRFVRDALLMRRMDSITLVLSRQPMYADTDPQPAQSLDATSESAAGRAEESDSDSSGTTVGEKLAAKWALDQEKGQQQMTSFQRRQQRRKDYFQQQSSRDDGAFILGAAAAFLLPALAILAVAFFSGYLDRLSDGYTASR